MRALVGHTGFVGANLLASGHYDACFNSLNSSEMRNRTFNEVVCAGVSAVKWQANKKPAEDWQKIDGLIQNLATVRVNRFILISTIDVYGKPVSVDESSPASYSGEPYGAHRAKLEEWVSSNFANHLIVRLPALYGPGLKKNALFDLQNDNLIDAIHPEARFQWYDVGRLEADLTTIAKTSRQIFNISPEPVLMSRIAAKFFPTKQLSQKPNVAPPIYDMRTLYPETFGHRGIYHFSAQEVMAGIKHYLE